MPCTLCSSPVAYCLHTLCSEFHAKVAACTNARARRQYEIEMQGHLKHQHIDAICDDCRTSMRVIQNSLLQQGMDGITDDHIASMDSITLAAYAENRHNAKKRGTGSLSKIMNTDSTETRETMITKTQQARNNIFQRRNSPQDQRPQQTSRHDRPQYQTRGNAPMRSLFMIALDKPFAFGIGEVSGTDSDDRVYFQWMGSVSDAPDGSFKRGWITPRGTAYFDLDRRAENDDPYYEKDLIVHQKDIICHSFYLTGDYNLTPAVKEFAANHTNIWWNGSNWPAESAAPTRLAVRAESRTAKPETEISAPQSAPKTRATKTEPNQAPHRAQAPAAFMAAATAVCTIYGGRNSHIAVACWLMAAVLIALPFIIQNNQ